MSKRDELNQLLKAHFYHESWHGFAALMVATAKEEALAEIRAERASIVHEAVGLAWAEMIEELDARLGKPAPPPSGDVGGPAPANGPVPGVDRITVSSEMGEILAAEATIDGKRYTMRGTPPPGARSLDLYHEEGWPAPPPFAWCAGCGMPAGNGHKQGCYGLHMLCSPYTGEPATFLWCKGCGITIGRDDPHADCPGVFGITQYVTGAPTPEPPPYNPLIDDHAEIRRLRAALREIAHFDSPHDEPWDVLAGRLCDIATLALDE